jgi:plastocyanin
MSRRTGVRVALCVAGVTAALPATAGAITKTVYAGEPPAASKVLAHYGASVNAFFLNRVTIHREDSVKFLSNGFHTIDLPDSSRQDLPLITSAATLTGINDAAGQPFWFNGKVPTLSLNLALVVAQPGTTYDGTKRILSPVPISGAPKPLKVTFTKPGTYKYFCDIHTGMVGYVVVKAAGKPIPSARQDAKALATQVKTAEADAKHVFKNKVPKNTVDLGQTAPGGVEDFVMFPSRLVVPVGTVVKFQMTKDSRELHTATFGPNKYIEDMSKSILSPAPQEQAFFPSDVPGPPVVTPTSHGNGFANTGFLDSDPSTTTLPFSGKLKFTKPGVYHYICLIHDFMKGTIVVQR